MGDLREKVARAIYDAPDSQSGDVVGTVIWNSEHLFFDSVDGEEVADTAKRASMPVCLSAADAAIAAVLEAMQEPTTRMCEAGVDNLFGAANEDWAVDAKEVWQAMLTAFRAEVLGDGA